jgi:hypothetical protein
MTALGRRARLNKTTVLVPTVSKPVPAIVNVAAFWARLAMLWVTTGYGTTVATWTAEPLDPPFDGTTASMRAFTRLLAKPVQMINESGAPLVVLFD